MQTVAIDLTGETSDGRFIEQDKPLPSWKMRKILQTVFPTYTDIEDTGADKCLPVILIFSESMIAAEDMLDTPLIFFVVVAAYRIGAG